jgi:hypothetical protein
MMVVLKILAKAMPFKLATYLIQIALRTSVKLYSKQFLFATIWGKKCTVVVKVFSHCSGAIPGNSESG